MNRSTLASLVLLLVGAAVLIGFRIGGADAPGQTGKGADGARPAGGETRGAGSSRSGARNGTSSLPLLQRLRLLLEAGPEDAPRFVVVERMAGGLADEELVALRDESAAVRPDSVGGWVRCAVYAELARRDFEAAFDFLQREGDVTKLDFWGMRQAWFATYRGWAEVDAVAATESLLRFIGPLNQTAEVAIALRNLSFDSYEMLIRQDDVWKRQALQEVFAQLARADAEAAWEALPAKAGGGFRESALEGLFRGLEGDARLPEFMARWLAPPKENALVTLEVGPSVGHADYIFDLQFAAPVVEEGEPWLASLSERSRDRTIAAQAAFSLALSDRAAAEEWLKQAGVPRAELDFHALLAEANPSQAIERNAGDPVGEGLLRGLFARHPDRLPELFAKVRSPESLTLYLQSAIVLESALPVSALFPVPGRRNRLPDYERRYSSLVEAVQRGGFSPGARDTLLTSLHWRFCAVVPEAKAAAPPLSFPGSAPVPEAEP